MTLHLPGRIVFVLALASACSGHGRPILVSARVAGESLTPNGHYACEGFNLEGPYRITLDVAADGEVYRLLWTADDAALYVGVGILAGDRLSVAYEGPGFYGVAVYTIAPEGLTGQWAAVGQTSLATENCRPSPGEAARPIPTPQPFRRGVVAR